MKRLLVLAAGGATAFAATFSTIPTIDFPQSGSATLSVSSIASIVVDSRFQNLVDTKGQTLIPPTLYSFAETFQTDLAEILGSRVSIQTAETAAQNTIFLTIASGSQSFLDAAGRSTSEGYQLTTTSSGVVITGASPLGVWWGTRTVLQLAVLGNGTLPIGDTTDSPGWGTRGHMLDVGRRYFPPSFLTDLCTYMSFFKQNTLHLHLSDNLWLNPSYSRTRALELYAAFRLDSNDTAVAGLVKPWRKNETYTYDVFNDMQRKCARRGVTIIPEIEAPGHALVITQWKPQLALADWSLLNIAHAETIPTMKAIWQTFLPWFHSKVVHIGADEYDSTRADDYNLFVNTLSSFISSTSNKTTRIWGTNEPGKNSTVSKDITIQHWAQWERNPYLDLIAKGYNVVNSDDSFYIVGKWSGSYPQTLNINRIFTGNPAGGAWAPHIFDVNKASNNPPRNHPLVIGHIAAQWNDYGPNATTVSEAWYSWKPGMAALADKQWGGKLSRTEYDRVFQTLHSIAPAQNLDRRIASKSDVILQYDLASSDADVVGSSGNGYHGQCVGCTIAAGAVTMPNGGAFLQTPLLSKGRDYTLSFNINVSPLAPRGSTIASGADSVLSHGNGTVSNFMLIAGNQPYALNYTLPTNRQLAVKLIGRKERTFLSVDGGQEMEFLTKLGVNGQKFVWGPIAVEAPLQKFGGSGFVGTFSKIKLTGVA